MNYSKKSQVFGHTVIRWFMEMEEYFRPEVISGNIASLDRFDEIIKKINAGKKFFYSDYVVQHGVSRRRGRNLVRRLVLSINKIHSYLTTVTKLSKAIRESARYRNQYVQVLDILQSLLEDCARFDPQMAGELPLTTYFLYTIRLNLNQRLNRLYKKMNGSDIDKALVRLLMRELKILMYKNDLTGVQLEYIIQLTDGLHGLEQLETEDVENLLIQEGFDHPSFFTYYKRRCNALIQEADSLHDQLEIVLLQEDRLASLRKGKPGGSVRHIMHLDFRVRGFLNGRKKVIRQKIRLRRMEIKDSQLSENSYRAKVNLSVPQFSLLLKAGMETGMVFKEEKVGKTFAFYARHFRTANTPHISPDSLQKKSTDVDYSTAKKVKAYLIRMVNWINEHHNTAG